MKILAFGATGYIGGHGVKLFAEQGHEVVVVTRDASRTPGLAALPGVTMLEADPTDLEQLPKLFEGGYDAVANYLLVWGDSAIDMLARDTTIAVHIAQRAAEAGVKHFVYTSSVAAFGEYGYEMEETQLYDSVDYYCATKAAVERFLIAMGHQTDMRVNICRPGIIFGESPAEGVADGGEPIIDVVRKAKAGEDFEYAKGAGAQLIHAADLAQCFLAIFSGDMQNQIFHTLSKPHTHFEAIARQAIEVTGSSSKITLADSPDADHPKAFTVNKINDQLGLRFDPWDKVIAFINHVAKGL